MPARLLHLPQLDPAQHNLLSLTSWISFFGHYLDVPGVASSAGIRGSGKALRVDLKQAISGQYELGTFAELCDCSPGMLSRLTYPVAQGSPLWSEHLFLDHVIQWNSLDVSRPRYCPQCIAESPLYSRCWDLIWYTTCHRHEVPLVQRCQDCEALLEWSSWNWSNTCSNCGEHRSVGAPSPAPEAVQLCELLSKSVREDSAADFQSAGEMGSLGEILSTISSLVVAAMPRAQLGRFNFSPHLWTIAERQELVAFAWPLVKDELSSTAAMIEMLARSRQAFPYLTDDSRCLPLRAAIESVQHKERLEWLRARLASAEKSPNPQIALNPESREEMATLEAVGTMLGTSRHNIMALLQAEMLHGRFAHEGKRRSDWVVSITSVDALLGLLAQVALHSDNPVGSSIHAAAKTPSGAAVGGLTGIVKAACQGRLRILVNNRDYRLSSLTVDPISLKVLTAPKASNALTVPEIASKLGLYADAVYRLMRLGFLPFRMEKRAVSPQRVVDLTDFALFSDTYAVVTQIATATKANPTNLSDRLMDAGLAPVSGPKVDGGLIYMFRREDLARVDLKAILARTNYKSRAGRPRKEPEGRPNPVADIVDSASAAKHLGVSLQVVGRLVRLGALIDHPSSHRQGNRRYVYRQQVTELISRYSGNPGLISIDEVAARLGRPIRSLYSKEVRAGRLRIKRSPLGRAFLYRNEVDDAFEEFREQASVQP